MYGLKWVKEGHQNFLGDFVKKIEPEDFNASGKYTRHFKALHKAKLTLVNND